MYSDFPAKSTVYTPYKSENVWFWSTLRMRAVCLLDHIKVLPKKASAHSVQDILICQFANVRGQTCPHYFTSLAVTWQQNVAEGRVVLARASEGSKVMSRVGHNRTCTPYMTVYLAISLPNNTVYTPYVYGSGQLYTCVRTGSHPTLIFTPSTSAAIPGRVYASSPRPPQRATSGSGHGSSRACVLWR